MFDIVLHQIEGYNDMQGVPRNMTVARRLESRLGTYNLLMTFSRQPILEKNNKCGLPFVLSILPEILRILFRFQFC